MVSQLKLQCHIMPNVKNAMDLVQKRARCQKNAIHVMALAKCACSKDFFQSNKPVQHVTAKEKLLPIRVMHVMVKDEYVRVKTSLLKFLTVSIPGIGFAYLVKEKLGYMVEAVGTCMYKSPSNNMQSLNALAVI